MANSGTERNGPAMQLSIDDLTFIVPTYNMQETTQRAVDSILTNAKDARIIIVDDASDTVFERPAAWLQHPNISIIRHERNRGAAGARNTGIENAKTEWLAFLDADDVLLPDTLQSRLDFVSTRLAASDFPLDLTLFGCGWVETLADENTAHRKRQRIRVPQPANAAAEFASGCWYCPGSALIAHRSVYEEEDGRFNENLRRLEDFDWGIRFGRRGGRLIVDQIAGAEIDPSNRVNYAGVCNAASQIAEDHRHLESHDPEIWRRLNAYLELEKLSAGLRNGKPFAAALSLARSVWYKPRLHRHFSPGWTYRELETPSMKEI